jgi:hypothetical protein
VLRRLFWLSLGFGLGVWSTWRVTRSFRVTVERFLPQPLTDHLRAFAAAVDERQALIRARKAAEAHANGR